jgi:hypothetical protein
MENAGARSRISAAAPFGLAHHDALAHQGSHGYRTAAARGPLDALVSGSL